MDRCEFWELSGFEFLVKSNPDRYSIRKISELDGMISVLFLIDNYDQSQIGRTLYFNHVKNTFASTIKTYKEISC